MKPPSILMTAEKCIWLAARQKEYGLFRLPLFQAVEDGLVRWIVHIRGTQIDNHLLTSASPDRPLIVTVCDDDGAASGLAAWPQAEALLMWTPTALLHGAKGEIKHYEYAVAMSLLGRFMIVETEADHLRGWMKLAQELGTPSLCIHPAPATLSDLQRGPKYGSGSR